ncbi:Eco57I restriction-modification methylase domain-containing protein [Albimonas pacifica]|uniref:site-specific DNA-methyltransferase (adenine-specific) n=1 Tax=Albimonas pacifica TaxID=1114924 RepID=A0A1I3HXG9_9RHOB|nr:Eco57I restriction-modification methylase domain-containing protein [Albimonas pacifica]SFI40267.1 adenine-specific DNA-methyltransferase [Albimonas pacifica]
MSKQEPKKRGRKPKTGCTQLTPMPVPDAEERPTVYADRVGEWYVAQKSDVHRKGHGLYLTPILAADFMAEQIRAAGERLRLLDPAAGAGILACAAVEELVSRTAKPAAIELVAYEVDAELIAPLRAVLDYLVEWCSSDHDVALKIRIEVKDFILAHAEALRLFGGLIPYDGDDSDFDVVISNPPYFKISKADPRAVAASSVVHGQPNIYGLFMAVSAAILKPDGDFVFIVPRSFASGPYFRQFRSVFFDMICPTEVHVFGSRRDAFSRDEVLQENIIFSGLRNDHWHARQPEATLTVSSSRGVRDISKPDRRVLPMPTALDLTTADRVLRLPLTEEDDAVLALIDCWPSNLHDLGLNISTGPVVPFRATELISTDGDVPTTHVPHLWMNHVKPMAVTWPLDRHKPEYIKRSGAEALLVPNKNYVLLRRFSAKEEARRLTAAPYVAARFDIPEVGFENHLNYIHRPAGSLTEDEAWGLAALYNSRLLDTYFRAVNGNTQVSATELRAMPLPPRDTIIALGRRVKNLPDPLDGLDDLVMRLVAHPEMKEAAVG